MVILFLTKAFGRWDYFLRKISCSDYNQIILMNKKVFWCAINFVFFTFSAPTFSLFISLDYEFLLFHFHRQLHFNYAESVLFNEIYAHFFVDSFERLFPRFNYCFGALYNFMQRRDRLENITRLYVSTKSQVYLWYAFIAEMKTNITLFAMRVWDNWWYRGTSAHAVQRIYLCLLADVHRLNGEKWCRQDKKKNTPTKSLAINLHGKIQKVAIHSHYVSFRSDWKWNILQ